MTEVSVTQESARITTPLVVAELGKSYDAIRALDGVSFRVEAGQAVGLIGENGAGKSTLFRILSGIAEPSSGEARVFERTPSDPEAKRRVGYLPEESALYPEMSGEAYLVFRAELRGLSREKALLEAREKASRVGADHYLARPCGELSKGQQKRLALAAALLGDPDLLLLDEPTASLDPAQVGEIRELLIGIAAERSVLLSTHVLSDIEAVCSRALVLSKGKLVADRSLSAFGEGEGITFLLRVKDPPKHLASLIEQAECSIVEKLDAASLVVLPRNEDSDPHLLVGTLAEAGVRIRELSERRASLEKTIVRLMRGDQ